MKTLIIYIDGVKCEFQNGQMSCWGFMCNSLVEWYRKNKEEIQHYKELTAAGGVLTEV